jgi:hypothetical protein
MAWTLPMRAPQRAEGSRYGPRLGFGAGTDGDFGIAQQQRLRRADDRLQTGTAEAVDVVGRVSFGMPAFIAATREI